jgi:cwf21 domain
MSSNVGLTTPRGSGTSGYVQRNLSTLKPRDTGYGAPYPPRNSNSTSDYSSSLQPHQRQPDQDILAHDRQREVEVQVFDLRDQLEDDGKLDEEEIEKRCDKLRTELLEEMDRGGKRGGGRSGSGKEMQKGKGKALKPHQVHELAEAKIKESERLRRALGIKEGREGKAWEKTSVREEEVEEEEEHDRREDDRDRERNRRR